MVLSTGLCPQSKVVQPVHAASVYALGERVLGQRAAITRSEPVRKWPRPGPSQEVTQLESDLGQDLVRSGPGQEVIPSGNDSGQEVTQSGSDPVRSWPRLGSNTGQERPNRKVILSGCVPG